MKGEKKTYWWGLSNDQVMSTALLGRQVPVSTDEN